MSPGVSRCVLGGLHSWASLTAPLTNQTSCMEPAVAWPQELTRQECLFSVAIVSSQCFSWLAGTIAAAGPMRPRGGLFCRAYADPFKANFGRTKGASEGCCCWIISIITSIMRARSTEYTQRCALLPTQGPRAHSFEASGIVLGLADGCPLPACAHGLMLQAHCTFVCHKHITVTQAAAFLWPSLLHKCGPPWGSPGAASPQGAV